MQQIKNNYKLITKKHLFYTYPLLTLEIYLQELEFPHIISVSKSVMSLIQFHIQACSLDLASAFPGLLGTVYYKSIYWQNK